MNAPQILAHPDQSLVKHLLGVAHRAREFATHFQGACDAELAGLLHDLGKADGEFQKRIAKAAGLSKEDGNKRPHAHHGAALALEHQLWPVAFAISGHHAGLHDRSDLQHIPSRWTTPARLCEGMLTGDSDWCQRRIDSKGKPPLWNSVFFALIFLRLFRLKALLPSSAWVFFGGVLLV